MADLKETVLFDLERELDATRRLLERVPDAHLGWKPHEKSFALGALAAHVANIVRWQTTTLTTEELDLAVPMARTEVPASTAALLETFDANVATLRETLAAADDDALSATWTLRHGDHRIMAAPRVQVVRGAGLSHLIHHRGQLTVYLRLLDVPVPGLYGPSADEG